MPPKKNVGGSDLAPASIAKEIWCFEGLCAAKTPNTRSENARFNKRYEKDSGSKISEKQLKTDALP